MYPQQIHSYLHDFFKENDCPILNKHPHYMTVQLTVDMDKRIMNRPFYWRYQESTGAEPNPTQLTFITDQNKLTEDVKGEVIHFGSPRLNQIFQVTNELGAFVQMFERVTHTHVTKTILTPWLGVNYLVSYYSDQTREMLFSLGINLMTGRIVDQFQESLINLKLDTIMSDGAFTLDYFIKPVRGLERLDAAIDKYIQNDDHSWAEEANKRWQKDRKVLEYFYEGVEEKPECYEMEKKAMNEQYKAKIKVEIVNGGLFYLK
ncbi:YqhG family protein [Paenisporosarcina quisquiliarum]|uniref:YqhG family protein n=1 Tax=Paenisporosarcina quisquiliarum TaxID=365346 RepID=UPI003735EB1A